MSKLDRRAFLAGTATFAAALPALRTHALAQAAAPTGPFKLDPLGYAATALEPTIDARTMEIHHGKHHAAYVNNLNTFAKDDSSLVGKSIEELVRTSSGKVFNNAAQVWNHTFYWNSMSPNGGGAERAGPGAVEPRARFTSHADRLPDHPSAERWRRLTRGSSR